MWKYVGCCLRETLQRSINYFDARCGAGLASNSNHQTCIIPRKENLLQEYQGNHRCNENFGEKDAKRNEFSWKQCHLLHSWLNAFTWSGALVLGWYSSQLLCINHKRRYLFDNPHIKKQCLRNFIFSKTKALPCSVLPRVVFAHPNDSEHIRTNNVVNTLHLDNCQDAENKKQGANNSLFENSLDEAVRGLANVLSSVENRLGLAAIQAGDIKHGVEMLQSAAQRNHAPALYNLALCYQKGVGVKKNEKMACELYREAAALDHPAAMYNLAIYHGQGRGGLKQDTKAAEKLLRRAASKGQEDALKVLPKCNPSKEIEAYNLQLSIDIIKSDSDTSTPCAPDTDPYTPMQSFLSAITNNTQLSTYNRSQTILLY